MRTTLASAQSVDCASALFLTTDPPFLVPRSPQSSQVRPTSQQFPSLRRYEFVSNSYTFLNLPRRSFRCAFHCSYFVTLSTAPQFFMKPPPNFASTHPTTHDSSLPLPPQLRLIHRYPASSIVHHILHILFPLSFSVHPRDGMLFGHPVFRVSPNHKNRQWQFCLEVFSLEDLPMSRQSLMLYT